MIETTADSSTVNLFRVENCPQCEYSLQGLPEEGACPECGSAYDRSAIILRCRPWGGPGMNSLVIAVVGVISAVCLAASVLFFPTKVYLLVQLDILFAFGVVLSAITLIDRATSPRVGEWLLWAMPAGIGVKKDFDPDSLLAQFRRAFVAIAMPVYFMGGFVPMMFVAGSFWYIGAIMAVVMGIGYFWFLRAMTFKPAIPAQGARPALFGWNDISRIEITGPKRGRYRLSAWRSSWVSKRQALIFITLAGSDEMIGQFRQRIDLWYRSPNHGN